jgi:hypothetical protein
MWQLGLISLADWNSLERVLTEVLPYLEIFFDLERDVGWASFEGCQHRD